MTLQTLPWRLHVAVSAPSHSSINEPLSYLAAHEVPPGTLVRVPLGRREVPGIVCSCEAAVASPAPPWAERPVSEVLAALPPLDAHWRALIAFEFYSDYRKDKRAYVISAHRFRRLADACFHDGRKSVPEECIAKLGMRCEWRDGGYDLKRLESE